MALYRSLALPLVVLVALTSAGCSGDEATKPKPVTTSRPGPTTSTSKASTTTVALVASTTTTTTVAAPPSTKPLVTAPPSPLLDEVVAAYDAAYADLLAAEFAMDENHPALPNHIGGAQLDKWREIIRGLVADRIGVRDVPGAPEWRRVEQFEAYAPGEVRLNVCRMQRQETVEQGVGTGPDSRPYRYLETLELIDGSWKWTGREWIDSSKEGSDCSLQS